MTDFVVCSNCFHDYGLRLEAAQIGLSEDSACPNCGSKTGRKLSSGDVASLAHRFFVWGTLHRGLYGAAPLLQANVHQFTSIHSPPWLKPDLALLSRVTGIGFFYYGPRLWMLGEIEPLKDLQDPARQASIVTRIIGEYPSLTITPEHAVFRIRKAPVNPLDFDDYDARLVFWPDPVDSMPKTSQLCIVPRICRSVSTNAA